MITATKFNTKQNETNSKNKINKSFKSVNLLTSEDKFIGSKASFNKNNYTPSFSGLNTFKISKKVVDSICTIAKKIKQKDSLPIVEKPFITPTWQDDEKIKKLAKIIKDAPYNSRERRDAQETFEHLKNIPNTEHLTDQSAKDSAKVIKEAQKNHPETFKGTQDDIANNDLVSGDSIADNSGADIGNPFDKIEKPVDDFDVNFVPQIGDDIHFGGISDITNGISHIGDVISDGLNDASEGISNRIADIIDHIKDMIIP